jgi:hypothetical protein
VNENKTNKRKLMKHNDNNDPDLPEDEEFEFEPDEEGWDIDDDYEEEEEDGCPYSDIMMSAILCPKPFGMIWPEEMMIKLLKKKGYKILTRHDGELEKDYKVAVKPGDPVISGNGYSNLQNKFEEEVQNIIMNWLLKISEK